MTAKNIIKSDTLGTSGMRTVYTETEQIATYLELSPLSSEGLAPMALRTLVIPAGLSGTMGIGLGGSAPIALRAPVIDTAGAGEI